MVRSIRVVALVVGLGAIMPSARAHEGVCTDKDDCAPCTRHRKAEWGPVFHHAKRLAKLDCHGLAMDAEAMRHDLNRQAVSLYNRPLVAPMAAPGPVFSAPALVPTLATPPADPETPADPKPADPAPAPAAPAPAPPATSAPAPPAPAPAQP